MGITYRMEWHYATNPGPRPFIYPVSRLPFRGLFLPRQQFYHRQLGSLRLRPWLDSYPRDPRHSARDLVRVARDAGLGDRVRGAHKRETCSSDYRDEPAVPLTMA